MLLPHVLAFSATFTAIAALTITPTAAALAFTAAAFALALATLTLETAVIAAAVAAATNASAHRCTVHRSHRLSDGPSDWPSHSSTL